MASKLIEFLEKEVKRLSDVVQSNLEEMLELPVDRDVEQMTLKLRIKLYREELAYFEKSLVNAKAEAQKSESKSATTKGITSVLSASASFSECALCGQPLKPGAKFCTTCGAKQEEKKQFCQQCGSELKPGAKFCTACGTPAEAATVSPQSQNSVNSTPLSQDDNVLARFNASSTSKKNTNSSSSCPSAQPLTNHSKTTRGKLTPKKGKDGWGYVDETEQWVIGPNSEWINAKDFNEYGIARISDEYECWRFIDTSGNYVSERIYDFYNLRFPGGYSWATIAEYDDEEEMYIAGLAGIIDESGNWVVKPSHLYDDLNWDSSIWYIGDEETWPERVKEEYGFEDESGNLNADLDDENHWVEAKQNGKYGFKDCSGTWRIEPKFEKVSYFSDGMCAVRVKGKWGYINRKGEMKVKPIYDDGTCFYDGRCEVFLNGESFEIDSEGNRI